MVSKSLKEQIEAAYDYRGHVAIHLKNGEVLEGFLYNREYENPKLPQDCFVDLFLKDKDERLRLPMSTIESLLLTGKDYAETFQQGQERTKGAKLETDP